MFRFLRLCAFFVVLFFTNNLMAAGYTCSTTAKYTSCNSGYYLSDCGTTASAWTGQTVTPTTGNSCTACPDGYECSGGTKCPVFSSVTCNPGQYLPANSTTCALCGSGAYYCPGGTFEESTVDQGRNSCPGYACSGTSDCATSTKAAYYRTTYPDNYHSTENLTLIKAWFTSSLTSNAAITDCRLSYQYTNDRGTFTQDSVRYTTASAKYNGAGGSIYYTKINAGYAAQNPINIYYCNTTTNLKYYSDAIVCPAGKYCLGRETMPECGTDGYAKDNSGSVITDSTDYIDGDITAGYFSEGGGTSATGTCLSGYDCGSCSTGTGANGRLLYSTAGAASCSECPAATGELADRVTSYSGWWSNNIHRSIGGCYANFSDSDDTATFRTLCYYNATDGTYGGTNSACQVYAPSACAGGYYSVIDQATNWSTSGKYAYCKGADCMKGKVCGISDANYFSPEGATTQTACTTLGEFYTTSPAGSSTNTACYGETTATKYIANANDATESTCAANGYCPGGVTVYYGSTGGRTACSGSYTLSASGSDAKIDCYTTCTAGTAVFAAGAACTTPTGAWFTDAEHNVYYGNLSDVTYWPSYFTSLGASPAAHADDSGDAVEMSVDAGYYAPRTATPVRYVRLTGVSGNFPLSALTVRSNTGVSYNPTALTAGTASGWGILKTPTYTGYAIVAPVATFDFGSEIAARYLDFVLGPITGGVTLQIEVSIDGTNWTTVFYRMVAGSGYSPFTGTKTIFMVRDPQPCAAGEYSNADYVNGLEITTCSKVSAGYWNNGCGTSSTGDVCSSDYSGGLIAGGRYGAAGATSSDGSGEVAAGYYSTGGGTSATPTANGNGCVGDGNTCGTLDAGYYSYVGGISESSPTYISDDCSTVMVNGTETPACGMVYSGYYSTGGATSPTPTANGNGCVGDGNTCGTVAAGYYSVDGGTSATGTCLSDSICGIIAAGYYSTGGATTATPTTDDCIGDGNTCGLIPAGYWNTGCGSDAVGGVCTSDYNGGLIAAGYYGAAGATTSTGAGQVKPGFYSTAGGTSAMPNKNGDGCVGSGECGMIAPGYFGTWAATTSTGSGPVAAGYYSAGGATRAQAINGDGYCYSGDCGQVAAGYYSTGGATTATPTTDDCIGDGNTCGLIDAGYYGDVGAVSETGTGTVSSGYYSTCGGTSATGACVDNCECGLVEAGYWSVAGAKVATPATTDDCIGMGGDYEYCGVVGGGYYSTGGATYKYPTTAGVDCLGDNTCGKTSAGYYSSGGGTSATGTCVVGYTCGLADAGYYAPGGTSGQTAVAGGYYSTGGATTATPTTTDDCVGDELCGGTVDGGAYSTGGGTSATGTCLDGYECGSVAAGYYSTGGAKTATPTISTHCLGDGNTCGPIAAGYYSTGGAAISTGNGSVDAGYYSTGGGTSATPAEYGDGCIGYNDSGENTCGLIPAGYWNTGCGSDAVGGVCTSDYNGGLIAAGYYGVAGATSSTGSGTVRPGYFSTGGATAWAPESTECVGENTCGLVAAGYWTSHGGKTATPTNAETDCVNKACGILAGGYYSTGGATRKNPTEAGNHCLGTDSDCGILAAEYYSSGGGTSTTGTCLSGYTCGACNSNYLANTTTGKTAASQCQASCAAGTRVVSPNAACTTPSGAWYTSSHTVNYGQISPVNYCMAGYTSTSTSAGGHDAVSDCTRSLDGGTYVAAKTIDARYIKVSANGSTSNSDTHMLEIQAFASNDGTGTNLLSGKDGVSGSKLTAATDGSWTRGNGYTYAQGTDLIWDMGSTQAIGSIKFAMYTDGRTYHDVTISVSTDNSTYTTVMEPIELTTPNTTEPTGELVVLSAIPTDCAAGTYLGATSSIVLTNTNTCAAADAGYFVGTTGASTQTKCKTGSYTSETGQSACVACAPGNTNSADGSPSCTDTCSNATGVATDGWETTIWNTNNTVTNLCTIKATAGCSANYYKNSNACSTCSSGTGSKYTLSAAGTTTVNDCYLNTTETNYVATAGAGQTTCEKGSYCPGSVKVYYGGTASDAHPTSGGSEQCPAGYQDGTTGYSLQSQCLMNVAGGKYVATANESTASGTCEPGYAKAAHTVTYGKTSSCDPCKKATYAANKGQPSCTVCPTVSGASSYGYWNTNGKEGDHTVRDGCNATFKNPTLDDGTLTSYSCYIDTNADTYGKNGNGKGCWVNKSDLKCNGGYYNKKFNDNPSATQDIISPYATELIANICRPVEEEYYSPADSLTRTACENEWTTCGSGLCANEAGDCGRKLHAGDLVIHLRSEKRTTPSLNVKIGDDQFYGTLGAVVSNSLRVKNGTTNYSVVNDNQ